jgi:uncharacterized protein (DUF983 family)
MSLADFTSDLPQPPLRTLLGRAARRRCPWCGGGHVFEGWLTLKAACPTCRLRLERGEADYFVGAYSINLILMELLCAGILGGVVWLTWPNVPWTLIQWGAIAAIVLGAIVVYPYTKLFYLATDLHHRPLTSAELEWHWDDGAAGARELPHT